MRTLLHVFLALRIYGLINSFLCFYVLFTNVNVSCFFLHFERRRNETQNLCKTPPDWNYVILPARLNITLVSVVIELSCASHTYKPRSSTVVFNICNSYCLSSSLLVPLNLSLPLKAGLIVESWDMMKPLFRHLRVGIFSYWHDSTAVPV
jgi:hypothetical protein